MGVVVIFEPDLALLRTALEHVDHTSWMTQFPFLFVTDPGGNSWELRGNMPDA